MQRASDKSWNAFISTGPTFNLKLQQLYIFLGQVHQSFQYFTFNCSVLWKGSVILMLQLTPLKDTRRPSNKSKSSKGNIPYFTSLSLLLGIGQSLLGNVIFSTGTKPLWYHFPGSLPILLWVRHILTWTVNLNWYFLDWRNVYLRDIMRINQIYR